VLEFLKPKFFLAVSVLGVCGLSVMGCQTTGVRQGLDPLLGLLALEVVSDSCNAKTEAQNPHIWQNQTFIEDIRTGPNGWVVINFSHSKSGNRLIKGQATYNTKTLHSACSGSPQQTSLSNALVIYSALISNESSVNTEALRARIKNYIRPVNFIWSEMENRPVGEAIGVGENDAYQRSNVFTYHRNGNGHNYLERGWLNVKSPYGSGNCSGIYQLSNRYPPEGTWQLHCPSKVSVTGVLKLINQVPYNDNSTTYFYKTAVGDGIDSHGLAVRFSMPWRDGENTYSPF